MKAGLIFRVALLFFSSVGAVSAQEFEATSKPLHLNLNYRDTNPPDVFLIYKNQGIINVNGKVEVEIRVFDESGVKKVSINDVVRMEGDPRDSVAFLAEFAADEEVSVQAIDNVNYIRERAFIIKGQSSLASSDLKSKRKYYALLIGVDEYVDRGIISLSEPVKDATLLRELLVTKYTFESADVTFLKNPTFEEINVAFEGLSRKISPEDLLLIFYAGHGYFDMQTNIGYWLPSDAAEKNKARWFRNSALVENIGAINSKHTFLIADACFSGGIFKTRAPFNNASADYSNMMKRPSRKAMTSGSLTTVPDKSVFMKYLLKTLEENQNMYLSSEDLFDEVRSKMKNNSDTKPQYGEIQNAGDEGGNFVLVQRN